MRIALSLITYHLQLNTVYVPCFHAAIQPQLRRTLQRPARCPGWNIPAMLLISGSGGLFCESKLIYFRGAVKQIFHISGDMEYLSLFNVYYRNICQNALQEKMDTIGAAGRGIMYGRRLQRF
jgi:hypothetical protein